jgi:hypothetical protein
LLHTYQQYFGFVAYFGQLAAFGACILETNAMEWAPPAPRAESLELNPMQ